MNTLFVFGLKGEVTEGLGTAAGHEKRKWAFRVDKRWSLIKRTRFLCSFDKVKRSRPCPLQLDMKSGDERLETVILELLNWNTLFVFW